MFICERKEDVRSTFRTRSGFNLRLERTSFCFVIDVSPATMLCLFCNDLTFFNPPDQSEHWSLRRSRMKSLLYSKQTFLRATSLYSGIRQPPCCLFLSVLNIFLEFSSFNWVRTLIATSMAIANFPLLFLLSNIDPTFPSVFPRNRWSVSKIDRRPNESRSKRFPAKIGNFPSLPFSLAESSEISLEFESLTGRHELFARLFRISRDLLPRVS